MSRQPILHRTQSGGILVEFALASTIFFTLLLGAIEMGRMLWTWNAAVEATRAGARLAAVCEMDSTSQTFIKNQMIKRLPVLSSSNITLTYAPSGCTSATCQTVSAALTGYTHQTIIPFVPLAVQLPAFKTTLRKELMQSTGNPVCN